MPVLRSIAAIVIIALSSGCAVTQIQTKDASALKPAEPPSAPSVPAIGNSASAKAATPAVPAAAAARVAGRRGVESGR